jgi:RimJ/RimL family protein N-acetyltransferase
MKAFMGLRCGELSLYLIENWNLRSAAEILSEGRGGSMRDYVTAVYAPRFNSDGERTNWGFYIRKKGIPCGLCSLWIDAGVPQTGADILPLWRGQGIASGTKPCLFHLAFAMLGFDSVETGCDADNAASKASIEKTPGFEFSRMSTRVDEKGREVEVLRYVITRESWLKHYKDVEVGVL